MRQQLTVLEATRKCVAYVANTLAAVFPDHPIFLRDPGFLALAVEALGWIDKEIGGAREIEAAINEKLQGAEGQAQEKAQERA